MGDLVTAGGEIFSGLSEQGAANAEKKIARQNAEVAARNAEMTMATAESQQEGLGMRNKAVAGKIKANQGSSGVDIKSGSSTAVRDSQRELGLFDTMTLKSNAAREAFGFKTQEKQFLDEAAVAKAKANNAMVGASINAFSSLLSGASSASSAYSSWQSAAGKGEATGLMDSAESAAILAF